MKDQAKSHKIDKEDLSLIEKVYEMSEDLARNELIECHNLGRDNLGAYDLGVIANAINILMTPLLLHKQAEGHEIESNLDNVTKEKIDSLYHYFLGFYEANKHKDSNEMHKNIEIMAGFMCEMLSIMSKILANYGDHKSKRLDQIIKSVYITISRNL